MDRDAPEVGTLGKEATEREAVGLSPYREEPSAPVAAVTFVDFRDFVAKLSSPEAVEQSKLLAGAYDSACTALIGPNDVQEEGGKVFKKKSAWRKLGRHFFISVRAVGEPHGRWEQLQGDTVPHFVAVAQVIAMAPWGQSMPGFGACSTRELRFWTQGPACPKCAGPTYDNRESDKPHFICRNKRGCGGRLEESQVKPGEIGKIPNPTARAKAEHDCLATAETRAINRATSELIAMGEVSWEEVDGGDHRAYNGGGRTEEQPRAAAPSGGGQDAPQAPGDVLDGTVGFGKHKGSTFRKVAEEHPDDAWWFVKKAERVSDAVKKRLEEYLNQKAEVTTQDAVADEPQDLPDDPLLRLVPTGKFAGRPWGSVAMDDAAYIRKMMSQPFGVEHFPPGSELRAGLLVIVDGLEPTAELVVRRWLEEFVVPAAFVPRYAKIHPLVPNDLGQWSPENWGRLLHETRKVGPAELVRRVEAAEAQTPRTPSPPVAAPGKNPVPTRMREQSESCLAAAVRRKLPDLEGWKARVAKSIENGDQQGLQSIIYDLQQAVFLAAGHEDEAEPVQTGLGV